MTTVKRIAPFADDMFDWVRTRFEKIDYSRVSWLVMQGFTTYISTLPQKQCDYTATERYTVIPHDVLDRLNRVDYGRIKNPDEVRNLVERYTQEYVQ